MYIFSEWVEMSDAKNRKLIPVQEIKIAHAQRK